MRLDRRRVRTDLLETIKIINGYYDLTFDTFLRKRLRAEPRSTKNVPSSSVHWLYIAARHLQGAERLCAHAQFVHMRMAVAPETRLLATKSCIV